MLSIDSSFIHFCVFSRLSNLKKSKEGKPVLYRKGPLTVIYASANQANQLISFPKTFLEQMLSKSLPIFKSCFTTLYLDSSCQTHQKSSYQKPCEFGLRNFELWRLFMGFLWFFPAHTFPLSANTLHYAFSLLAHV